MFTILRIPATYGWPDNTRIDDYLLPMLSGADTIWLARGKAGWRFSRCLHKNAAFAAALAIESASDERQRIYNVADAEADTEEEWIRRIGAVVGWHGDIREGADVTEDFTQDFFVSSDLIRTELGFYEKYDPIEGLKENIFFSAYQQLDKPYQKTY
jgi:nucleoside-diphosphate-sugar epimerase